MKKQQINPPEMNMRIRREETTLTALSPCRQRPVNAPSTCRQHRRQRSLQETGPHAIGKNIDGRKDLGRKRINLAEICVLNHHISKSARGTIYEVQE